MVEIATLVVVSLTLVVIAVQAVHNRKASKDTERIAHNTEKLRATEGNAFD